MTVRARYTWLVTLVYLAMTVRARYTREVTLVYLARTAGLTEMYKYMSGRLDATCHEFCDYLKLNRRFDYPVLA